MIPALALERRGAIVPAGTVSAARAEWSRVRAAYGLQPDNGSALLTLPDSQPKLGLNKRPVAGITLTAGSRQGLCVSDRACRDVCVTGESYRATRDNVRRARAARVAFLTGSPGLWATLVRDRLLWAHDARGVLDIRPNVNSDLAWERVAPFLFDTVASWGGRAYDYSKRLDRVGWHGDSYRVTYSATGSTSIATAARLLDRGDTVAVVLPVRKGEPVPADVWGYPTVDGDVSDDRAADPAGHVIVLRAKGVLRGRAGHPLFARVNGI